MRYYVVRWISRTSNTPHQVKGDYMSCCIAHSIIQQDEDVKGCTFVGPLIEVESNLFCDECHRPLSEHGPTLEHPKD